MNGKLLELATNKLLEKFGAGNHKPGSGSAAAFNGMLSANLIHTVITLTTEEKHKNSYGKWFKKLHAYDQEINDRIIPELERFFEEDSIQFDKVIKLREQRNDENNLIKKTDFEIEHLEQLKLATELPIEIGKLCHELAKISEFVFRNGFQSARGDSFVALSSAVSSVTGCLSIIELNLLSFQRNVWTEKINLQVNKLRSTYNKIHRATIECSDILKQEVKQKNLCDKEIIDIIQQVKGKSNITIVEIEETALRLQRVVWKNKDRIWKIIRPEDPIEILKPDVVLKKILGYQCYRAHALNSNNGSFEPDYIAGTINQQKKVVLISNQYPTETQNFTMAHELGHAIFHKQTVLHRDRPLDGSMNRSQRNPKEYQADKFATYFLMPTKQVKEVFEEFFLMPRFIVNEDNAFNLIQSGPTKLRSQLKNLRGLSRKLASTSIFGPSNFNSMNSIFGVSVGAMAIRLEELELVEF